MQEEGGNEASMRVNEVNEGGSGSDDTVDDNNRDLFETVDLYPNETWLPMTVWVSPRALQPLSPAV
jgi:hypothetical protein